MMTLRQWQMKWGIPDAALEDLRHTADLDTSKSGESEAAIMTRQRLQASQAGHILWRNQVGALPDERGRWVRFGLANDSKAMNRQVKSADLIGAYRLLITPSMVGSYVAQLWSVESKRANWQARGDERTLAQIRWKTIIERLGGRAEINNGDLEL